MECLAGRFAQLASDPMRRLRAAASHYSRTLTRNVSLEWKDNRMEPLAVTVNEAAACLGIGRTSLYRCISENKVDVVRISGRTLITTASLKRLIEMCALNQGD